MAAEAAGGLRGTCSASRLEPCSLNPPDRLLPQWLLRHGDRRCRQPHRLCRDDGGIPRLLEGAGQRPFDADAEISAFRASSPATAGACARRAGRRLSRRAGRRASSCGRRTRARSTIAARRPQAPRDRPFLSEGTSPARLRHRPHEDAPRRRPRYHPGRAAARREYRHVRQGHGEFRPVGAAPRRPARRLAQERRALRGLRRRLIARRSRLFESSPRPSPTSTSSMRRRRASATAEARADAGRGDREIAAALGSSAQAGILFGRERIGLTNDEVSLADESSPSR